MKNQTYHGEQIVKNTAKLRKVLKDFPDFALDFFTGIDRRCNNFCRIDGLVLPGRCRQH